MKLPCLFCIVVVATCLAGCGTTRPAFVPVPETVFRSETNSSDRLALPLTPGASGALLRFLCAGGNRDNLADNTLVDPTARTHYGPLLELLGHAENLAATNLTAGAGFARWFPQPAVRQVVDAREDAPPAIQPYALLDDQGRYWWVFYPRHQQLLQLMVIKAMPAKMKR